MAERKTRATDAKVSTFLDGVTPQVRRQDGYALYDLMRDVSGVEGVLWGPSIVGFGDTTYTATDGEHRYFVIGFSPRKASLSLYGLYNAYAPDPRFERLGKHKTGAGCLYITRLEQVDLDLLRDLAEEAWAAGKAPGT